MPAFVSFVSIGSAMIDDIVWPDGRTMMGVLGGGGPHAAAGMSLALSHVYRAKQVEAVGLVSLIGDGFPDDALTILSERFDLQGCVRKPLPHPRAWQLFEHDGRRTEVFRQGDPAVLINIPEPTEYPSAYATVNGVHLLREGGPARAWIAHLRTIAPKATILWEPAQRYMRPENRAEFVTLLPLADVVSPNLAEAAAIYGIYEAEMLVQMMLRDGAPMVALRMGDRGSLVASQSSQMIAVPAEPIETIVDETGAGNMYCGAFLVAWCQSHDLATAARVGKLAGKAALNQCGLWKG